MYMLVHLSLLQDMIKQGLAFIIFTEMKILIKNSHNTNY